MKILYKILKIALWCVLGLFAFLAIYQCYDYLVNPITYDYTSVPWYLSIIINGILAAVVCGIILIAMWFVKKKIK